MDIKQYEQALKTRLETLNTPTAFCDVVFLEQADTDNSLKTVKPRVEVVFTGSTFEPTYNAQNVMHREKLSMQIQIISRNLRGSKGAYDIATDVKRLIVGFKPFPNTEKLQIIKTELYRPQERGGDFVVVIETSTVGYVLEYSPADTNPLITQIVPNVNAVSAFTP